MLMHELSLTGMPNVSRLGKQLSAHSDTVQGSTKGTYKLRASSRDRLDDTYSPILGRRRVKPSDSLVPRSQFASRRKAWRDLVEQINGCYDHGFYDGAAVLCRRLVEALIVEVYKAKGLQSRIQNSKGDFLMLDGLIGELSKGHEVRLSKSAKPGLEPIQRIGNTAAHSPYHITTKQDIDKVDHVLRVMISDLLGLLEDAGQ